MGGAMGAMEVMMEVKSMMMGMVETMSTRGMMMAMEVAMEEVGMVEMATRTKSETPPPLMIPMNMMMMTTTTMVIIITTTQMLHTLTTLRCRTMCLKTLTRSINLTRKTAAKNEEG